MKALTRKARRERCQGLIDRYPLNRLFNATDLAEFMALTGQVMPAARRMRNPQYPNDPRHVQIQHPDGHWSDLSWNECISPTPPHRLVKRAMRGEVQADLDDFLAAITARVCGFPGCGATENLTVDHVTEPFDAIATDFIARHGPVELADGPSGVGRIIADRDQAAAWIQFHSGRAVYGILCRSCNASKGCGPQPYYRRAAE